MAEKIIYNIDVDAADAIHSIEELNHAFDGTQGNADNAASSMSRLSSAQGTLSKTSDSVTTAAANTAREFNKENQATTTLEQSTQKLEAQLLDLEIAMTKAGKSSREIGNELELARANQEHAIATSHMSSSSTTKNTAATQANTVAVQDNGGAIAMLDMVTGGYASILKNAWESRTVFSSAQTAGTVVDTANTVSTEANTAAKNKGILATIKDTFVKTGQTISTKWATVAQWNLNAAMAANPIGAVVAVIALLIGTVYGLIKAFQLLTDNTDEQTAANVKMTKSLEDTKVAQEDATATAKMAADQEVALATAKGLSVEAIEDLKLKLAEEAIARAIATEETNKEALAVAENTLKKLENADADEEVIEAAKENVKTAKDLHTQSVSNTKAANNQKIVLLNSFIVDEARRTKKSNDDKVSERKKHLEKMKQVAIDFNKESLSLEEENNKLIEGWAEDKTATNLKEANAQAKIEYKADLDRVKLTKNTNDTNAAAWDRFQRKLAQNKKDFAQKDLVEEIKAINNSLTNQNLTDAQRIQLLRDREALMLQITGQSAADLVTLSNDTNALIQNIEQLAHDEKMARMAEEIAFKEQIIADGLGAFSELASAEHDMTMARLEEEKNAIMGNTSLSEQQKLEAIENIEAKERAAEVKRIKRENDMFTLQQTLGIAMIVFKAMAQAQEIIGIANVSVAQATAKTSEIAVEGAAAAGKAGMSLGAFTAALGPYGIAAYAASIGGVIASIVSAKKTAKAAIRSASIVPISGAGGGGGGSFIPQTPNFNVVGQSAATVGGNADNAQAQMDNADANPQRAYVVSTEVTSQQELDRAIESQGELG